MGCPDLIRIILIVVNVITLLFGGAIMGVCLWIQNDSKSLTRFFSGLPSDVGAVRHFLGAITGIGIGLASTTFGQSWMGFVGACSRRKIMLFIYAGIIGVLLLLEIIGISLVAAFSGKLQTMLTTNVTPVFKEYNANFTATGTAGVYEYTGSDTTTRAMDSIHVRFECCGMNGYQDFYNNTSVFPTTCCTQVTADRNGLAREVLDSREAVTITVADPSCPYNPTGTVLNTSGCYDKLESAVKSNVGAVIGVFVSALVCQATLIIMAVYLGRSLPDCKKNCSDSNECSEKR